MTESLPHPPAPKQPRRRQPERLRRNLLDVAARLAVEAGVQAVTVAAVARGAGVTKGGLFHHFPDKETLISALFSDCLAQFDQMIDHAMSADPDPHGRFTRAYITATLDPETAGSAALNAVLLMEPGQRELWSNWLRDRLVRHAATDHGTGLALVRHAADGIWLADLWQVAPELREDPGSLLAHLIALTRQKP